MPAYNPTAGLGQAVGFALDVLLDDTGRSLEELTHLTGPDVGRGRPSSLLRLEPFIEDPVVLENLRDQAGELLRNNPNWPVVTGDSLRGFSAFIRRDKLIAFRNTEIYAVFVEFVDPVTDKYYPEGDHRGLYATNWLEHNFGDLTISTFKSLKTLWSHEMLWGGKQRRLAARRRARAAARAEQNTGRVG